jgi:hypothetical protein
MNTSPVKSCMTCEFVTNFSENLRKSVIDRRENCKKCLSMDPQISSFIM